jgi:pyrimidine-nucleoside phosphorylase
VGSSPTRYTIKYICVKKIGNKVNFGDTLCVLHTNKTDTEEAETIAKKAFYISALKPKPIKYVYDVIK